MERIPGERVDAKRIAWKIFLIQQVNLFTTVPFALYVVILLAGVPREQVLTGLAPMPITVPICGVVVPFSMVLWSTRRALAVNPGDPPGARLIRILKLPRRLELQVLLPYTLGTVLYMAWLVYALNRPVSLIPWGTLVVTVAVLVAMIWTRIFIERLLMPISLEEFLKYTDIQFNEGGLLWPKLSWYLPYSFALFIFCTVVTMGTVIIRVGLDKYEELLKLLDESSGSLLRQSAEGFMSTVWLPLLTLGLFMLVSASMSALLLVRHQQLGFRAIQDAIEGFVSGNPKQPEWVTTDELGDLARVTARAFDRLREFSLSLRRTASSLGRSAEILDESNMAQNEVITRHAAAIQQAQVTAQEIRQTSLVAAQKAESVIQQTDVVEKLTRDGEIAIAQSIDGLQEIRRQVSEMSSSIRLLGERARQIENITRTVKDLADQSNMLALNAAIEAVRSGEHGKGFGVVAREIRALADQSIQATARVRQILQDISMAIRSTVEMTEQGSAKVENSVELVRAFGDSMRKLSSIMKDNTSSVRQISAAVSQQNQGISQIFEAINDLNLIMNETLSRLNSTSTLTVDVRGVADEVSKLIASHGWERVR